MSIKVKYYTSRVPVDWNWPVQIGFIKQLVDSEISLQAKDYYWLNRLAHLHLMSRFRKKTNILVLNGHLKEINNTLSKSDYMLKADLLVVFLEKGQNLPRYYNQAIKKLHNIQCNSFYVTVIPEDSTYLSWLNEVIFQLSHNNKLDEIINDIVWPGILVASREMVNESRLHKVFDKILDKINQCTKYKNYNFDKVISDLIRERVNDYSRIQNGKPKNISEDILKDIKQKKETFEYNHESEESALIKDIFINHSANISDMVDNIGEEREAIVEAKKTGARYLQCLFQNEDKKPVHHALLVNKPYTLTVKIDAPNEIFLLSGEVSKDDVDVLEGQKERVDILLRYHDKLEQKHIMLPHKGASDSALFNVKIAKKGETQFEIFAFHKNRLFQQLGLSVFFCEHEDELGNVPGMKIVMINMPRTTLSPSELKQDYRLSLVFTDSYPLISQDGLITQITNEEHINKFNQQLTDVIEKFVKSENPNAEDLIFALSEQGSLLYRNMFDNSDIFDKPIQIISPSTKHFPLEFLYTYKLHRKAKKLCPNASSALEKGKCASCNDSDDKYICPFGFVSLRTVIERHRVGENVDMIKPNSVGLKTDFSLNRPSIPILANTLFGTTVKVDASEVGLRKRLGNIINSCSNNSTEANDWDEWEKAIASQKPDSLVIIGHVERSKRGGSNQLEIGKDLLRQTAIEEEFVRVPSAPTQPFLILIGCNTHDVELSFLDFANHFKKCGAAIVLSTFTKIRGSHAVPLVEKLIEILHSKKGKKIPFGEAMIELRRKLFADNLYVSMALVSHGDADWILKI